MRNLRATIEYDGTEYLGFQRHPGRPTIQGELEKALSRIMKEPSILVGAGRTDAGVHALGQVISFRTAGTIPTDRIPVALNSLLPGDIVVRQAAEMLAEFHARYSAKARAYKYTVRNADMPSAMSGRFEWHVPHRTEIEEMQTACEHLVGEHDFTSFSSVDMDTPTRVRELEKLEIRREGDLIIFELKANAFLHSMARIIVGTLIEVGQGRKRPEEVKDILEAKDRRLAGKTAPPQGLVLVEVIY